MLALLAFLASAHAADACAEIQNMVSVGLPEDVIIEGLKQMTVTTADVACLGEAGVSQAMLRAARAVAVEVEEVEEAEEVEPTPKPTPKPEPQVQEESTATELTPTIPQAYRPRPPAPGCSDAYLMATLPDPGAAAALSGFVGFGAGSFYAKRPLNGLLAMAPQVIGLGLVGIGLAQVAEDPLTADPGLARAGWGLFALGRMADVAVATGSAHSTRREVVEACGY
ncbi:MAG: hypothetical protein H6716_24690 [Polyangiaceae bacterium]|nr:hypothetical protein [Polyangiaceae bacterium]